MTAGEVVASINNPIVDRVRLDDLLMEVRLEEAARSRIAATLSDTQAIQEQLVERTAASHLRRLEDLRERLSHAEARLAGLEAGGLAAEGGGQSLLDAVQRDSEFLPAESRLQALALDHARERVTILGVALEAAEAQDFLGRASNEPRGYEQRATELSIETAALTSRLAEAEERIVAIRERADQERVRVNALRGGELRTPVSGILWEVLQADGVNVQRGDPVLRVVDCGAMLVTLSVSERVFNGLNIGQPARFRLNGSAQIHEATVGRLAGNGAETIYRNLAVAPSQRHLERFDVALIVPALSAAGMENCRIGRTGRAFFESRPLDWLRGMFS